MGEIGGEVLDVEGLEVRVYGGERIVRGMLFARS